jgi:hypothetical protein
MTREEYDVFLKEFERIDYRTFYYSLCKYEAEMQRIFNELKKADDYAGAGVLVSAHRSRFSNVTFGHEYYAVVTYIVRHSENTESFAISIPTDILFNDEKIQEWLNSQILEELHRKERHERLRANFYEERDRNEFERLKEKFGQNA